MDDCVTTMGIFMHNMEGRASPKSLAWHWRPHLISYKQFLQHHLLLFLTHLVFKSLDLALVLNISDSQACTHLNILFVLSEKEVLTSSLSLATQSSTQNFPFLHSTSSAQRFSFFLFPQLFSYCYVTLICMSLNHPMRPDRVLCWMNEWIHGL